MCLSVLTKKYKNKIGYKVVKKINGVLISPYQCITYDSDAWNIDTSYYIIKTSDKKEHLAGYFIFKTKRDAIRSGIIYGNKVLYKVEYGDVVAEGKQYVGKNIVVARRMRFLEKVKV